MKKTSRPKNAPPRSPNRRENTEQSPAVRLAVSLARILPLTLAIGLLLSFAAAAFAVSRPDPDAVILPLALCISALMSLLGGWLTFRSCRRLCLVCGLTLGISLVLVFCLMGCLLPRGLEGTWQTGIRWALRGGMIAFSVLGALLGAYAPRKKRKKKKR